MNFVLDQFVRVFGFSLRFVFFRLIVVVGKPDLKASREPEDDENDRGRAGGQEEVFESDQDADGRGRDDPRRGRKAFYVGVAPSEDDHPGAEKADPGDDRSDEIRGVKADVRAVFLERHGHELSDNREQYGGDAYQNMRPQARGLAPRFAFPPENARQKTRHQHAQEYREIVLKHGLFASQPAVRHFLIAEQPHVDTVVHSHVTAEFVDLFLVEKAIDISHPDARKT